MSDVKPCDAIAPVENNECPMCKFPIPLIETWVHKSAASLLEIQHCAEVKIVHLLTCPGCRMQLCAETTINMHTDECEASITIGERQARERRH